MQKSLLIIFFSTIGLCGCLQSADVASERPIAVKGHASSNSLSQLALFGMQNAKANVMLRFSSALTDWGSGSSSSSVSANAVFTNDSLPVRVTTATVNGTILSLDSASSIYECVSPSAFTNPNSINWNILGYEGHNFTNSSTLPSTIQITSPAPADTIQASAGFTVSYSGSNGGDLIARVSFDPAQNAAFGSQAVAATGSGDVQKTVSDNGSASFSASELSSVTPGYVNLNLSHWEFTVDTLVNGRMNLL